MSRSVRFAFSLWLASASIGYAQVPAPVLVTKPGRQLSLGTGGAIRPRTSVQTTKSCRTITYEGLQEKQAIPTFNGVSSSGWVAGISVLAYNLPLGNPSGGHAQFSGQPSGVTAAVFLNGSNNDINFATPISAFQYYYATGYPTQLTAYDSGGNILAQHIVNSNWSGNPNGYDRWTQIPLVDVGGNLISKINILSGGPPLNNFLGIDNLTICTNVVIDSIEVTQAIQQIQTLADLQTSLSANNEPPVPLVSGKEAALRVYMKPVTDLTVVDVRLTIPGVFDDHKLALLVPGCSAKDQRYQNNQCLSTNFYFTAPPGSWAATINVTDPSTGDSIEQELLSLKSRDTFALKLVAVSTCDTVSPQSCEDPAKVLGKEAYLRKIAPSNNVTMVTAPDKFYRPYAQLCPNGPGANSCWNYLTKLAQDLAIKWIWTNSATDVPSKLKTVYVGAARAALPLPGALANQIPGHSIVAQSTFMDFGGTFEDTQETIAHEVGHTLGLQHTNSANPPAGAPPGCSGLSNDRTTDWPWKMGAFTPAGNNRIQSLANLEVGYDVLLKKPLNPAGTYEIMAYCIPQWIAPQRWKTALQTLGGGAVTTPSFAEQPRTSVSPQSFWTVTGSVPASGPIPFGPLFTVSTLGDAGPGSGAYSLEVQNAGGAVLFTRNFDVEPQVLEHSDVPLGDPAFTQLLPVTAGAARIVLKDGTGAVLGTIPLGGVAPTVAILSPTASFTGQEAIHWTITDPDSTSFTSLVFYSADNGATWSEIGQDFNSGTTLYADFTTLPGTNGQGKVKVVVSDGVNTGEATSASFTIPKKKPSLVKITSPDPNFTQAVWDSLILTGTAYDTDDGVLSGNSLSWASNLQGSLGTGAKLSVNLQPGVHQITLTATDSDNNSISATTTVTIGVYPPVVSLSFKTLSAPPSENSTCEQATVNATPGDLGAPLASVQYSTDGGSNFTNIPLNQLPFTFVVPTTGFIDLVVTATDAAGQGDAQTAHYFNSFACASLSVPNVVGLAQSAATAALAGAFLVPGKITMAASSTVASGSVAGQNPGPGAALPPGTSNAVDLIVSSGPQVAVPNVVSLSQADASTAITAAGLVVGTVTTASSGTVPAGSVITETPGAGTLANAGSAVNLLVSSGIALAITGPSALPSGTVNLLYASTTMAATGGTGSYTWTASGLPPGLSIGNLNGIISGIPTTATGSPFHAQVTVTDAASATASQAFDVTVLAPPSLCDVTGDGKTNLDDVLRALNEALAGAATGHDLNADGVVNVLDVQIVINAIQNLVCTAH